MASSTMARVSTPACPVCGSTQTRPSQRRQWRDWSLHLLGGSMWRCRACRERFVRDAGGACAPEPAPAEGPAARIVVRSGAVRRLRRWWHNSYRWRLQNGRRLLRQTAMVASLMLLAGLFVLFLVQFTSRAPE
jgi:hypothetical protein